MILKMTMSEEKKKWEEKKNTHTHTIGGTEYLAFHIYLSTYTLLFP